MGLLATMPRTCKVCGQKFAGEHTLKQMNEHKLAVHGLKRYPTKQLVTPIQLSAFDRLLDLKEQVKSVIKDLEAERDQLHARIVKIDTIIAAHNQGKSILQ